MATRSGLAAALVLASALGPWSAYAAAHDAKFMQYDIRAVPGRQLHSRTADTLSLPLINQEIEYAIDISLGTPPQKTLIVIDTGSTYFWVNPNCDTVTAEFGEKRICESVPVYDPTKSTTVKGPLANENIIYGNNGGAPTSVNFTAVQDTLSIGGIELTDMLFGVATNSIGLMTGIMGLGPDLQAGFDIPANVTNAIVMNQMVAQGKINSRAYSITLTDATSDAGSLIFGGIDTGKYTGALQKMPVVPALGGETRFTIDYSSIGIRLGDSAEKPITPSNDTNVVVDTGTTFTKLNPSVVQPIFEALDAKYNASQGYATVDCEKRSMSGGIVFGFGKTKITVSFADFIIQASADLCIMGLMPLADGNQQILGDSFMRSAFVVFDWDNKNVLLAQAANCASNIIAIGKGPNAVPSVLGSCKATGTSSANSTTSATGTGAISTSTSTSTSLPVPTSAAASRLSHLAAGCMPFALALSLVAFYLA